MTTNDGSEENPGQMGGGQMRDGQMDGGKGDRGRMGDPGGKADHGPRSST